MLEILFTIFNHFFISSDQYWPWSIYHNIWCIYLVQSMVKHSANISASSRSMKMLQVSKLIYIIWWSYQSCWKYKINYIIHTTWILQHLTAASSNCTQKELYAPILWSDQLLLYLLSTLTWYETLAACYFSRLPGKNSKQECNCIIL